MIFAKRRALIALVSVPLVLGVAACGNSTVDSSEVTSSTKARASEKVSASSTTTTTTKANADDIVDPVATRAEEAPSGQMPLTDADEKFLDALIAAKIDVKGVEDQLIGAGHAHCVQNEEQDKNVMVNAMAGQLIAQERAKGKAPDVASAIAKAAEEAYC